MTRSDPGKPIVALVSDLVFGSRISAIVAHLGLTVRVVRSSADLLTNLADVGGAVLDLTAVGDIAELVAAIRRARPGLRVAAFVPHVQVALARAAEAAGVDAVKSRSEFTKVLPEVLADLAGSRATGAGG